MNIHGLRRTSKQRLHARNLQAAQYGSMVDPSVTIEIQNLSNLVASTDVLLAKLELYGSSEHLGPFEEKVRKAAKLAGVYIDSFEYSTEES